jgi:hypothetical protein
MDPLNVTLLYLYFQNYIIMEKMERIEKGEDLNSANCDTINILKQNKKDNTKYWGDKEQTQSNHTKSSHQP